jgi:predicted transcriptional regulator
MRSKRDRLEIIYDILSLIRSHGNSIRPTPLLRKSNLSTQGFAEYIKELLEKGFVREMSDSRGKKLYTLTDKGFAYINNYNTIKRFIKDFDL